MSEDFWRFRAPRPVVRLLRALGFRGTTLRLPIDAVVVVLILLVVLVAWLRGCELAPEPRPRPAHRHVMLAAA